MKRTGEMSIGKRILAALSACVAAGCASNAPYHSSAYDGSACSSDPASEACLGSLYQEFASHDMAFAEFTELGNAFDDKAVEKVLAMIDARARDQAVVVFELPHGWKHNDNSAFLAKLGLTTCALLLSGRHGAISNHRQRPRRFTG